MSTLRGAVHVAALFYDVATPCFSHVIDYMNEDYEKQESTEELTEDIIKNDKYLLECLKEDNIDVDDVINFKKFSIVDNDRPKCCADRLDGVILTGIGWTKNISEEDIKNIINDVRVFKNKDNEAEIGFSNRDVVSKIIDVSKRKFNYIEHRNNAYKLLGILFGTSLMMFAFLFGFYDLDFKITMIYFSFEIVNFLIYPIYRIKTCYLQLEYSAFKITSNKIIASILRMFMSLLKTPFCTGIGQVCSSIYQFITVSIMFDHNFKIDKTGCVIKNKSILNNDTMTL